VSLASITDRAPELRNLRDGRVDIIGVPVTDQVAGTPSARTPVASMMAGPDCPPPPGSRIVCNGTMSVSLHHVGLPPKRGGVEVDGVA